MGGGEQQGCGTGAALRWCMGWKPHLNWCTLIESQFFLLQAGIGARLPGRAAPGFVSSQGALVAAAASPCARKASARSQGPSGLRGGPPQSSLAAPAYTGAPATQQ